MIETLAVQKILNDELARCKAVNPAYSLRSMARRLKVSPAALSLLLNGRRKASRRFALSMAKTLALDPKEEARLMRLFQRREKNQTDSADLELKADQFHCVADWHYFAILSLLETKNVKSEASWIGRRLGISAVTATHALERLERLDLVKKDGKGQYVLTKKSLTTTDDVISSAIRKHHTQVLDLAKTSLEQDALELRDLISMTMAIDPRKLAEAKNLMREFRAKLTDYLETGKRSEVYVLAMQLIPLTKSVEGKL